MSFPSPSRKPRSASKQTWLRAAAIAALVPLVVPLSGCLRLQTELNADQNDHVSGSVVIATPDKAHQKISEWQVPGTLHDKVTASDYDQDGYKGKQVQLDNLSFEEFNSLVESLSEEAGTNIQFRRTSATSIELDGIFDFSKVTKDKADLSVKVTTPGPLKDTDGQQSSDTAVSWTGKPGETLQVHAEAASTPDSRVKMQRWTVGTMLVGLLTAAGVMAWTVRNSRHTHSKLIGRPSTSEADKADEDKKPNIDDWAL